MLLLISLALAQQPEPLPLAIGVDDVPLPDTRSALVNLRVWDAVEGSRAVEAVVVDKGHILSVGPLPADLDPERVLDLEGATVIPGLMDMHVHLSLSPGSYFRLDEDAEAAARHHLAAYVACGVTTVLDTGIPAEDAAMIRRLEASGPSPEVHLLGPLISPPGGYVSVVLPERFAPARDAGDVAEQFAAFDELEVFGVKATLEEGMILPVWPTYSEPVAEAIFAEADRRGLGVYAHAMSAEEYALGLELGVDGFVHPTQQPKKWLVAELAERELPVISTLAVFDHTLVEFEPERLDHPVVQRVVPAAELATARDEAAWDESKDVIVRSILPDRFGLFPNTVRRLLDRPGLAKKRLKRMQRSVNKQYEAGVPIVAGSDSGNWPVFLTEFHGPTSLREIELLAEAGLGAEGALTAATWTPAELLGLEAEAGRIAPGYRADLVVLPRDPTADLSAIWEPTYVVRDGVMDTPDGWMRRALPEEE